MRHPAKIYLATFVVTVVGAFISLCFLPDDPYIRYQLMKGSIFESTVWIYERIHFDPTPIDIAFIGGSRTGSAINSPLLEELLKARGDNVHTVNLAIPASGFGIDFSLAKRLLNEKTPRILVIGILEMLPRGGHQAFGDIADPIDIMRAPLIINPDFARNIAYLPMRQIRCMHAEAFPAAGGYTRTWNEQSYLGSNVDNRAIATGMTRHSLQAADEETLSKESSKRALPKHLLPKPYDAIEFGASEYYFDEIIQLAKSKNVQVCFLYLPLFHGFELPLERDWLESRAPIMEGTFLRSDSRYYTDVAHYSDVGSDVATRWMADQLDILLKSQKKN